MIDAATARTDRRIPDGRAERLDALARSLDDRTLVALIAPSGYGKTVALQRFRRHAITRGHRTVSLDAADLTDALAVVAAIADGLDSDQSPPATDPTTRLDEVFASSAEPVTILIDRVGRMGEGAAAALDAFLLDQRIDCHIVIAGRTLPRGLRAEYHVAYGRLAVVGAGRLATSPAEALAMLAPDTVDDARLRDASAAVAYADGWPAALDIALVRLRSSGDVAEGDVVGAMARGIATWLDDRVWPLLSEDDRRFATDLALLADDRIDEAVAAAVSGCGDVAASLARIAAHTPFLRRNGDDGWRLRPFAPAYLAARAEPADRSRHHQRVANCLHAAGQTSRAIVHAIAARRDDLTAGWIAEALRDAVARGTVANALEWLQHLAPNSPALRDADTVMWVVWALAIGGEGARARAWLSAYAGPAPIEGHIRAVIDALVASVEDDPDHARQVLIPYREAATAELPAPMVAVRSNCFRWIDQQERSSDVVSPDSKFFEPERQFYSVCMATFRAAQALLNLGRSREAVQMLEPMRQQAERRCTRHSAAFTLLSSALAAAYRQAGNPFDARVCLAAYQRNVEATTIPDILWLTQSTRAEIAASDRHWSAALEILDGLTREALRRHLPRIAALALAQTIRIAIRGDCAKPRIIAAERLDALRRSAGALGDIRGSLTRLAANIGLAHAALAARDGAAAGALIVEAAALAQRHNRLLDQAEIDLLAVEAGAASSRPVAIDAADRRTLAATIGREHDAQPAADAHPGRPTLTAKEIEILGLLGTGISNKRIAEALLVSTETVKWHLKNIFNKLDVHDREHVIARVREFTAAH